MPEGDQGSGRLRVRVSDERGRRARADGLGAWLALVAPARARGIVSVALVSDRRIRALNRSYLRKDYATDVLSFPAFARTTHARASARQARLEPSALSPEPFLGDIVIARGVARRQARAAGHAEGTELRILALHGLLHLLGYDHERDKGRMLRVERRLRRKGGLREGLIERARDRRFDSRLILSRSKDERLAQDRPVRPRAPR
jgi:probable rRNA maturation factor